MAWIAYIPYITDGSGRFEVGPVFGAEKREWSVMAVLMDAPEPVHYRSQ